MYTVKTQKSSVLVFKVRFDVFGAREAIVVVGTLVLEDSGMT